MYHVHMKRNRVFFHLKDQGVVQQVLINTLLSESYFINELAELLDTQITVLYQVQSGKARLDEYASLKLVTLFYSTMMSSPINV